MKETGTMTEAARKDTKKQATRFTSKVTPYRDLSGTLSGLALSLY